MSRPCHTLSDRQLCPHSRHTPKHKKAAPEGGVFVRASSRDTRRSNCFDDDMFLTRFGGDLLSHVLRRSTIGAAALNCRVRDGIGCFARAMTTKPRKEHINFTLQPVGVEEKSKSRSLRWCMLSIFCAPKCAASLLLDQIKPIGQLVSVN